MVRDVQERYNLLTAAEMGTNCGSWQADPGICFHPVCVDSHTKNTCTVIAMNSRTKNTVTPEDKRLAPHRKGVEGGTLVHSRIFFCSNQGVIRITVSRIETLVPLLNDKTNVPGGAKKGLTKSPYTNRRRQRDNNQRLFFPMRMILGTATRD